MKLQTKFILMGVSLIAIMAETEWLSYQNRKLQSYQETAFKVSQRNMDSDIKHDAIRGNIYSSLYAARGDEELNREFREEIATLQEDFLKSIEENLKADIPQDIRRQLEKIQKKAEVYANYSLKISQSMGDPDKAADMLPKFYELFKELENDQGKASEMILAWSGSIFNSAKSNNMYLEVMLYLLFIISIALPVYAVLSVFKPMTALTRTMRDLSSGNHLVDVPFLKRRDEMGEMATSVQVFKQNSIKIQTMMDEREAEKQELEKQKRQHMQQFAGKFESSVKGIVSQVAASAVQMQSGAADVTYIASDTKQRSNTVVSISNEAAQISSHVAAAAEELTASIKEISAQTQKSSQIASDASTKAESAQHAIELLSEKSSRVSEIIEVITGIAGQINLLALNATIESARAGDAGKGFAVVASEVKNLAMQVSKATGEITQQIHEMQGATKTSVDSVMEILSIIGQVSASTSAVAAAVEEQSAVTNEIAQNISRTAAGTQEISSNMLSVQDGARQTGDTASQVLETAKSLGSQSDTLKQKVDEFLDMIRAA